MKSELSVQEKTDKLAKLQAPAPQASRRKSHGGEQINFTLPLPPEASCLTPDKSSTCRKRKRHWRSPSNPVDFMNCIRQQVVKEEAECIEEITLLTQNTKITMLKTTAPNTKQAPSSSTRSPPAPPSTHNIAQLNFGNFLGATPSALGGINSGGMTVINGLRHQQLSLRRHCSTASALQSYETQLLKRPQGRTFPMTAELSISPVVSSGNSSDYTSTRRHTFTFDSAYGRSADDSGTFDSTSLAHGRIDPPPQPPQGKQVTFSRCSLLQLILRNPEDNSVAGIFVVKLDLSDMPPDSRTILRQKAYKSKCLSEDPNNSRDKAADYLAKFIEIPLKRVYDPEANRQRILLAGSIRVAYSFNRSNLRYTSPRRSDASAVEPVQKTRTVLQFPSASLKYFPLESSAAAAATTMNASAARANSLTTDSLEKRSFPHGSLCL